MAKDKVKEEGKSKKILLIALALLVLGLGSFGGFYLYLQNKDNNEPKLIEQTYYEIGEVMVNLKDKSPRRYLKATISIGYDKDNKDLTKELEEKHVVLRDATIFYLKGKNADDFNADNSDVLKRQLVKEINKVLQSGEALDAYISDIIVQ